MRLLANILLGLALAVGLGAVHADPVMGACAGLCLAVGLVTRDHVRSDWW